MNFVPRIPKILHIEQIVTRNPFGSLYALDVAVMDDGSKWEIPCAGNGMVWRKVYKSYAELQVDFEQNQLALMKEASENEENGEDKTKGQGVERKRIAVRAKPVTRKNGPSGKSR